MALALPSKKIQALIIVVLALFIAYFVSTLNIKAWISSLAANTGKAVYNSSLESVNASSIESDIDTDGDGLKDWQETLWGTDANNTDSDSDGTPDGEEIKLGRDPKIKGPDDSLEKTRGVTSSSLEAFSNSVSGKSTNLSQNLSKDLFAKFMNMQYGGKTGAIDQGLMVNSVLTDIDPGLIPPKYTTEDIKAVNSTNAALKKYGNDVARLLTTFRNTVSTQKDNKKAAETYGDMIESLQKVSVPTTLALNHLQILNNLHVSHETLGMLINYNSDPLKGLIGLRTMNSSAEDAQLLFDNIAISMKKNGILFSKDEPGALWNS